MKKHGWKILAVLLVAGSLIAGLSGEVPARFILQESIRNLYFHVPMWFTMMALYGISLAYSLMHLRTFKPGYDRIANAASQAGLMFGLVGLVTGSIWARYTWGDWWTNDVKLNGAAVSIIIYLAYALLRSSIDDENKRGRIAAVYNVFAFTMMMVLIMVLPRIYDSLHPGNGGNPAFNQYDLDNRMKPVFYSAVAGWILMGIWMFTVRLRIMNLESATSYTISKDPLDRIAGKT